MDKNFKNIFSLIFISWTTVFFLQILEICLRYQTVLDYTLWLPLFLFSSVFFVIVCVPTVLIVCLFVISYGKRRMHVGANWFYYTLGLYFVLLFSYLNWLLVKIYYEAEILFIIGVIGVFVVVFLASAQRHLRQVLCWFSPVILLFLMGFSYINNMQFRWRYRAKGPNVLVVVVDTLRKDHTSFSGYHRDTTPFLKSLADKGVVFDNAFSTSSWTKPAMASLFTSKNLLYNTMQLRSFPLFDSSIKMPEYFYRAGYETAFFSANPNTGTFYNAAKGFKYVLQPKPSSHYALYNFILPRMVKYYASLPKRLQFNNISIRLKWYQKKLRLDSIKSLMLFSKDLLSTPHLIDSKKQLYQKQIQDLLVKYDALKKSVENHPDWHKNYLSPFFETLYQWVFKVSFISLQGAQGEFVVDHWINDKELSLSFIQWYERVHRKNKPFFVHLQYMGPHNPYQEQPPNLLPYFDKTSQYNLEMPPVKHVFPSQGAPQLSKDKLNNLISNYDDSIKNTDSNIKTVIEYLKNKGELKNTLIVFLSDHGEAFYEHKIYDHMYSLYSELVNIPMFFYWKKQLEPAKTNLPASILDVFPSLVTLTGSGRWKDRIQKIDGVSLFDDSKNITQFSLNNRIRFASVFLAVNPKPVLGFKNKFDQNKKKRAFYQGLQGLHRMVVFGDYKLVHEIETPDLFNGYPENERLYLFSLSEPQEPLVETDFSQRGVKELYKLFQPLPDNIKSSFESR